MSLTLYKKKREFTKTPEPEGRKKSGKGPLRFVIQKHEASRLHYDFRLELDGVLKSWAVPKGLSLNPADKRLAMMVEDHPYDYRDFEGIIPEGNYGAGTVMLWDEGSYTPLDGEGLSLGEQEKILKRQLRKGDIKIQLNGKKIKGAFALVRLKKNDDNSWLLIKKNDKHASEKDITTKARSVRTGRTLKQIEKDKDSAVHESNRKTNDKQTSLVTDTKALLKEYSGIIKKQSIPQSSSPMLATLVDESFDDDEWNFELKWDGYRALAFNKNGKADIRSRNNLSFNRKFPPITQAVSKLPFNAVIDGEIVALDEHGMPGFQLLQSWSKTGEGELVYYVFDLLWLDGYDCTGLPLEVRRGILQQILPPEDSIRFSDHIEKKGKEFFDLAMRRGIEGIMAKKKGSIYIPGARSTSWLKIKTTQRQEAVIAGFTRGRSGRQHFGSLILGVYEQGKLIYAGHTGSGFDEKALSDLHAKLRKLETKACPFETVPKTNMPATWVKPELVAEIKFQEWTRGNLMRHPIFTGLRTDKKPKEVAREKPKHVTKSMREKGNIKTSAMSKTKKAGSAKAGKAMKKKAAKKKTARKSTPKATGKRASRKTSSAKNQSKNLLPEGENNVLVELNKKELKLTNLEKLYWKKEGITKGDMIEYYYRIAPYMLPYMKDRPQSLNRFPNGANGMSFYQKDVKGKVADWVETFPVHSESTGEVIDYYICRDEASLVYLANLGCIEMNPWHSRVEKAEFPDYCLIDLDPHEIGFAKVIETARVVKEVLDALNVPGYCKTSGATGLHIYIPLGAKYDYDQSRQLAELLVTLIHYQIPSITSLERSPSKRRRKVYLDFLQNRQGQTVAAPYSLRPRAGAPVSTPLHWDEVKPGLDPGNFTINNIFERLDSEGDIFKPVMKKGIDLEKTLRKIAKYLEEEE